MREALAALWNSIIKALTMFNKGISTADHYVGWMETQAEAFAEEEQYLLDLRKYERNKDRPPAPAEVTTES